MGNNICCVCDNEAMYTCLECSKGFCYDCAEKEHISNKRGLRLVCPECKEELERILI